jgi:tetratricopeptide (TPR) repeat protein
MPDEPQSTYNGPIADGDGDGDAIDARNSQGALIKPQGPVTQYFAPVFKLVQAIDDKVLKRIGLEQRVGFALLAILILGVGLGVVGRLRFMLRSQQQTKMAGTFCIAVAGFVENDTFGKSKLGIETAQRVSVELRRHFSEMDLDIVIEVWGPDQAGWIEGANREERAVSAEELAKKLDADIVVYGSIDTTRALWTITPEFYVAVENFYEAQEVVGQYEIGTPFSVVGGNNTVTSVALNDALSPRVEILSRVTVGLARYAARHYELALETFQSAEMVEDIEQEFGIKQVLYLLAGNAAGKSGNLEMAEQYYHQGQNINPDYARIYAGLGNVSYARATDAYAREESDIAMALLEESLHYYQRALDAPLRPALSDIESKVHFARGRIYLLQAVIGQGDMGEAAQELMWVVTEYEQSEAERLRERAAEAHKLLGLIYRLSERDEQAVVEYKQAIALIEDVPQLHAKLAEYYAVLGDTLADADQLSKAAEAYRKAVQFSVSLEMTQQYQEKLGYIEDQMGKPY